MMQYFKGDFDLQVTSSGWGLLEEVDKVGRYQDSWSISCEILIGHKPGWIGRGGDRERDEREGEVDREKKGRERNGFGSAVVCGLV